MANGDVAGGVIEVGKAVFEYLEAGDIAIKTERLTSRRYPNCLEQCPPPSSTKFERVLDVQVDFFGLTRARLVVFLAFEFNGCDVNDLHAVVGSDSFVGFLSGASFVVELSGGDSIVPGPSGCECCKQSACINVTLRFTSEAALTFGTGSFTRMFRVCGDGSVTEIAVP